jgi:zinc protease
MTQAIRKTVPAPLAPLPFNISQPYQTTLENGLKVVVFEDKRLPLVSYRLAFLSGEASDPNDRIGATAAMASMLTEGTINYSSRELAEKIERLGASISANSSDDFMIVAASALSMYSSEVLGLVAEIVFRPTFPEDELSLYRRNTIEHLKFQRSQPNFLANEQTARILYGEHPYARISPSASDVEKLSREVLTEIHAEKLVPDNAILIAVGDIGRDDFLSEIAEEFGTWKGGTNRALEFADPPVRTGRTLTIVDRPLSAQSNIVLANLAIDRTDPDYFATIVMNQVLGAGASSRVFMNLREEKGYTYGAYTRFDTKRLAGDFGATAEVRTDVTGDSIREFFFELERIRAERVGDQELRDAKNFLTGVFPIRAETQEGLTNLLLNQQLYGLPEDYLQTYRENIEAITVEDVQRVAAKYISPDRIAIVIVGDGGEVLRQARSYSDEIEIFDSEGHVMEISGYEVDEDAEAADVAGNWELALDFQGQMVKVKLTLDQKDDAVTGSIDTVLGTGKISEGTVTGNSLRATAITEIQGQSVDLAINGSVDGDSMKGTISTAIIPDSLSFEGKRSS